MEPMHQAALDGDVATIDRLVTEDGRRLNARIEGDEKVDGYSVGGCTPLMLAAWKRHDAAVARLLALGADVGPQDAEGCSAVFWACSGHDSESSALALLLEAGASINACRSDGWTPLIAAVYCELTRCVALLIDRGGDALDMNAQSNSGRTALHWAVLCNFAEIMQLLLQAGADPTIRNNRGEMPLDTLQHHSSFYPWFPLLEAVLIEPQRTRALLDAAHATNKARTGAQAKGNPAAEQQQQAVAAAPVYLKQRVAQAQELPRVSTQHDDEKLAACVKYALGLEGGGGVVFEGQEPTVGMLPEVLVELLELLVPKWDPARKGQELGEGYIEVGGQ